MTPSSRPRLEALTGLRYVAALCVFVAHTSHTLPPGFGGKWLFYLSALGMPLFFTLSGFLMAYNYAAPFQQNFRRTLRTYYVARVARIYPVYLLCVVVSFGFMGCFFNELKDRPADVATTLAYQATLTQSWVHVPVFQDHFTPRTVAQGYLGVSWSVSTEAFFYLVFPLLALPLARFVTGRGRMLAGAAVVFAAYLVAGYLVFRRIPPEAFDAANFGMSRGWWKLYLCPYMRFGEFLIGALAGQYFLLRADRPPTTGAKWWTGAGILTATTVLLVGGNFVLLRADQFGLPKTPLWLEMATQNVLYAPLCATIIYQLAALPSVAQRALGCRPMVVLGEMSYCLYLLHPLAQSLFHPRAGGEGPLTDPHVVLFNNLVMAVVLHFLCLGVYRYWEVPARERLRAWLDPKPTLKVLAPERLAA
ncbi:MAG TPA: acyltransferase [Urbifossiella sp.]|nr:acyltransferase [Urbifossiella sp.]